MKRMYLVELSKAMTYNIAYDWSGEGYVRKVAVYTAGIDKDWAIVEIERDTEDEIEDELWGQINDGLLEDAGTGNVIRINDEIGRMPERWVTVDGELTWVPISKEVR